MLSCRPREGRAPGSGAPGRTAVGRLTLRDYETVVGVRVSGALIASGRPRARFTISGPSAAPGTLTFSGDRITGTLGGRRISIGGGAAALAAFVR